MTSNLLLLLIIAIAGFGLIKVSRDENARLIRAQLDALSHSKLDDLLRGDFRSFVEGMGAPMNDASVKISGIGREFVSRDSRGLDQCIDKDIFSPTGGSVVRVELCRPYLSPVFPLALLLLGFVFVSGFTYRIFATLESTSYASLRDFLKRNGVTTPFGDHWVDLLAKMKEVEAQLDEAKQKAIRLAESEAYARVARQVAHDIKSPIAVLNILARQNTADLEARGAIDRAITRIRDISRDLMDASKAKTRVTVEEVKSQLSEIVQEKKIEHPGFADLIELTAADGDGSVRLNAVEFRRILSNLMNNAIEASSDVQPRPIRAELSIAERALNVSIRDEGRGIPVELLPRLGKEEITDSKPGGTGVGLFHAAKTLEAWGGLLRISSKLGSGCEVVVSLPLRA
jgi:signal transduction histidine kinase